MYDNAEVTKAEVKTLFDSMSEEGKLHLINKTLNGLADSMGTQGYAAIPFYLREALARVNSASGAPTG